MGHIHVDLFLDALFYSDIYIPPPVTHCFEYSDYMAAETLSSVPTHGFPSWRLVLLLV